MKTGFFVWNPFQIYQFESIVRNCPGATYVLQRRKNVDFDRLFPPEFLEQIGAPIQFVTRDELAKLDGVFDAMVCQTAFGHMERFDKTKVVGMQYSMSKERHQYGPWRLLCDLNLVYGQYSYDKVSHYSPSVMVGNPRFDRWFENRLEQSKIDSVRARLDPAKKTILYLPTWGELSSMTEFGDAVAALSQDYNVIAKVHHKTDSHEASRKMTLNESGVQDIFGASDDLLVLLSVADLVLSDYSGAIFDAINVGKPVILLQRTPEVLAMMGAEKFGLESIEYARRDMIGPALSSPAALADTVHAVFAGQIDFSDKNKALKQECFAQEQGCGATAAQAIVDLVTTTSHRPHHQIYVRDVLREYRIAEEVAKVELRKSKSPTAKIKRIVAGGAPVKKAGPKVTLGKSKQWLSRALSTVVRTFLAPSRLVVKKYVHYTVQKAGRNGRAYSPSWLTKWGAMLLLPSRSLLSLAARYDAAKTQDANVTIIGWACSKSKSVGLTPYITALVKYDRRGELSALVDELLAKPMAERMRYLQRIARANDYLGTKDSEVRKARQEVHAYITKTVRRSKNKARNTRMLNILAVNRWLKDAVALAKPNVATEKGRQRVRAANARAKQFMGEYYGLAEAANANYVPDLPRDDYQCLYQGTIMRVGDVQQSPIVEFHLPFYFFIEPETDPEARKRICAMLRSTLAAIEASGAAIVPKHQFRLDTAIPNQNWLISFSYHTTGTPSGWWHIKDAPFPGFFSIDQNGYSGWSSIESLPGLPEEARTAAPDEVDQVWTALREQFVLTNHSKYSQSGEPFKAPKGRYVFLPLQVVGDTVAKLAWIPTLELARMLARLLPERGYTLVVKQHPKCINAEVASLISQLRALPNVHVTNASIHEILPEASAVITVNSGVGLEALLHGKLVITTGRSEYRVVTQTATCEQELIQRIDGIPNGPDIEGIKRFLFYYVKKHLIAYDDQAAINDRVQGLLNRRNAECETSAAL